MGEVVKFAKPETSDAPKRKRRHEPRGWLLVPLRTLDAAKSLQDSLDACVYGESKSIGETIDWRAIYMILAALDESAKYL